MAIPWDKQTVSTYDNELVKFLDKKFRRKDKSSGWYIFLAIFSGRTECLPPDEWQELAMKRDFDMFNFERLLRSGRGYRSAPFFGFAETENIEKELKMIHRKDNRIYIKLPHANYHEFSKKIDLVNDWKIDPWVLDNIRPKIEIHQEVMFQAAEGANLTGIHAARFSSMVLLERGMDEEDEHNGERILHDLTDAKIDGDKSGVTLVDVCEEYPPGIRFIGIAIRFEFHVISEKSLEEQSKNFLVFSDCFLQIQMPKVDFEKIPTKQVVERGNRLEYDISYREEELVFESSLDPGQSYTYSDLQESDTLIVAE